jgi:hypothetical protein
MTREQGRTKKLALQLKKITVEIATVSFWKITFWYPVNATQRCINVKAVMEVTSEQIDESQCKRYI